jgi:hypothetical protein
VHIADPHQAVALDAVPEIVLHVQMDRAHAGLPDLIESGVAGGKRPEHFDRALQRNGADAPQFHHGPGLAKVDPHEAEPRVAEFRRTHPRQAHDRIVHGVIVVWFAHGFRRRFAEPDAHRHAALLPGRQRLRDDLDAAVEFAAEIQQHGCGLIGAGPQRAQRPGSNRGLRNRGRQQVRRPLDVALAPDDAGGRLKGARARIGIGGGHGLLQ